MKNKDEIAEMVNAFLYRRAAIMFTNSSNAQTGIVAKLAHECQKSLGCRIVAAIDELPVSADFGIQIRLNSEVTALIWKDSVSILQKNVEILLFNVQGNEIVLHY